MPAAAPTCTASTCTATLCEQSDEDGNPAISSSVNPSCFGDAVNTPLLQRVSPLAQGSIKSPRYQEMHRRVVELSGTQQRLEAQMRVLDAQSLALASGKSPEDNDIETAANASMQAALGAVEQQRDKLYDRLCSVQMAASQYSDILHGVTPVPDDGTWDKLTSTYQQLMSNDVDSLAPEQVLSMAQQAWAVQQEASDDLKDKVESLRKELESSQQQRDQLQQRLKEHENMLTKLHNQCSVLKTVMASTSPRPAADDHLPKSDSAESVLSGTVKIAGGLSAVGGSPGVGAGGLALGDANTSFECVAAADVELEDCKDSPGRVVDTDTGLKGFGVGLGGFREFGEGNAGPERFSLVFSKEVLNEHVDELLHGSSGFWAGADRELRRVSSTTSTVSMERASLRRAISEGNGWMKWGLLGSLRNNPLESGIGTNQEHNAGGESSLEKAWECFTQRSMSRRLSGSLYGVPAGARISFESTSTDSEHVSGDEHHASVDDVVEYYNRANAAPGGERSHAATQAKAGSDSRLLRLGEAAQDAAGVPARGAVATREPGDWNGCQVDVPSQANRLGMRVAGNFSGGCEVDVPAREDIGMFRVPASEWSGPVDMSEQTTLGTRMVGNYVVDAPAQGGIERVVGFNSGDHEVGISGMVEGERELPDNFGAGGAGGVYRQLDGIVRGVCQGRQGERDLGEGVSVEVQGMMVAERTGEAGGEERGLPTRVVALLDGQAGVEAGYGPVSVKADDQAQSEEMLLSERDQIARRVMLDTTLLKEVDAEGGPLTRQPNWSPMKVPSFWFKEDGDGSEGVSNTTQAGDPLRPSKSSSWLDKRADAISGEKLQGQYRRHMQLVQLKELHAKQVLQLSSRHEEAMRQVLSQHKAAVENLVRAHHRDLYSHSPTSPSDHPGHESKLSQLRRIHEDAMRQLTREHHAEMDLMHKRHYATLRQLLSVLSLLRDGAAQRIVATGERAPSPGVNPSQTSDSNPCFQSTAQSAYTPSSPLRSTVSAPVLPVHYPGAYRDSTLDSIAEHAVTPDMPDDQCDAAAIPPLRPCTSSRGPTLDSIVVEVAVQSAPDGDATAAAAAGFILHTDNQPAHIGYSQLDGRFLQPGQDVDTQTFSTAIPRGVAVTDGRGSPAGHGSIIPNASPFAQTDNHPFQEDIYEEQPNAWAPAEQERDTHLDFVAGVDHPAANDAHVLTHLDDHTTDDTVYASDAAAASQDAGNHHQAPCITSQSGLMIADADDEVSPALMNAVEGRIKDVGACDVAHSSSGNSAAALDDEPCDVPATYNLVVGADVHGEEEVLRGVVSPTRTSSLPSMGDAKGQFTFAMDANTWQFPDAVTKQHSAAEAADALDALLQQHSAVQAASAAESLLFKQRSATQAAEVEEGQLKSRSVRNNRVEGDEAEGAQPALYAPVERLLQQILPDTGMAGHSDKLQQQLHAAFTADLQDLQSDYVEALKEREQAYWHLLMDLKSLRESDSEYFQDGVSIDSSSWLPHSAAPRRYPPLTQTLSTAGMMPLSGMGAAARPGNSGGIGMTDEFPFTGSIFSELLSTLLLSPQLSKQRQSLERVSRDLFSPSAASPASSDETGDIIQLPVPPSFAPSWDVPGTPGTSPSYYPRHNFRRRTGVLTAGNPTPAIPGSRPRLSDHMPGGSQAGLVGMHSLAGVGRAAREGELGNRQPVRRRLMLKSPRTRPDSSGMGRSGLAAVGQVLAGALAG